MELDPKLSPRSRFLGRWKEIAAALTATIAIARFGGDGLSALRDWINAPTERRIKILERRTYRLCLDVAEDAKTLERCAKMARKLSEDDDE